MRCVRVGRSPPPPPPLPPPPPHLPPQPLGPPPDPPFTPFVLNPASHGPHELKGSSLVVALVGLSLVLLGLARYAGLAQACARIRHGEGMQRVSTTGDDEQPDGERQRKGKRRSKKHRAEALDELGAAQASDLDHDDQLAPAADWLLVLECEHAAGLLATAKEILQEDKACEIFSLEASTFVRDGDVWIRMSCSVSMSSVDGSAGTSVIQARVEERINAAMANVKFSLTFEQKPDLRVRIGAVSLTKA
eukprot:2630237-Prymnesium_polylepis.1